MQITRRDISNRGLWRIGTVDVRNASSRPGAEQVQDEHILVFPIAGVFAKHVTPRQRVVGTSSDAVLISADQPYRLSYPAGIGDRCLTIRFSDEAAAELMPAAASRLACPRATVLMSAAMMVMRNLIWRRSQSDNWDDLELDELGGWLAEDALALIQAHTPDHQRPFSSSRWRLEIIKEAVASDPAIKWRLSDLGKVANVSPYHLSKIFRKTLGTTVYDYVLRARLALALELLVDTELDLTAIAFEAGFSSHSHFSARFRAFFGLTPTAFRRAATSADIREMRRIVTAARH